MTVWPARLRVKPLVAGDAGSSHDSHPARRGRQNCRLACPRYDARYLPFKRPARAQIKACLQPPLVRTIESTDAWNTIVAGAAVLLVWLIARHRRAVSFWISTVAMMPAIEDQVAAVAAMGEARVVH